MHVSLQVLSHLSTCLARLLFPSCFRFFFNESATREIYTLSLHDALPISRSRSAWVNPLTKASNRVSCSFQRSLRLAASLNRSEEHTSELQSHHDLVCRLLLEKKKKQRNQTYTAATANLITC